MIVLKVEMWSRLSVFVHCVGILLLQTVNCHPLSATDQPPVTSSSVTAQAAAGTTVSHDKSSVAVIPAAGQPTKKLSTTTTEEPLTGDLANLFTPIPLTRQMLRIQRKLVHQSITDPTIGYTWDLQNALYGSFHIKVAVPHRNVRQILILSFLTLEPKARKKTMREFRAHIINKKPAIDKKEEIQERELKLLDMGVYAQCQWALKLPPPFDDTQCTVQELDLLIRRICIDKEFQGLPICPEDEENIPILT